MMGREAYKNHYILAEVDSRVLGLGGEVPSRHEVVHMMLPYMEQELAKGNYLSHMTRHILGLFQNMQGARAWRRHLSENACKPGAGIQVVLDAMAKVPEFAPTESVE